MNEERLMFSVMSTMIHNTLDSPAYQYLHEATVYATVVYSGSKPELVKVTLMSEHDGWTLAHTVRYSVQEAANSFGTWPQMVEGMCKGMLDDMWKEITGEPPERRWSS